MVDSDFKHIYDRILLIASGGKLVTLVLPTQDEI